eukprot:2752790-Pleurochrysis_carterae.AAC.1
MLLRLETCRHAAEQAQRVYALSTRSGRAVEPNLRGPEMTRAEVMYNGLHNFMATQHYTSVYEAQGGHRDRFEDNSAGLENKVLMSYGKGLHIELAANGVAAELPPGALMFCCYKVATLLSSVRTIWQPSPKPGQGHFAHTKDGDVEFHDLRSAFTWHLVGALEGECLEALNAERA